MKRLLTKIYWRKILMSIVLISILQFVSGQVFTAGELISKSLDGLKHGKILPLKTVNTIEKNITMNQYYLDSMYVVDNENSIQFYVDFSYDESHRLAEGVIGVMGYRLKWEYQYDENSRLSKMIFYMDSQIGVYEPVNYTDYFYDENGLLDYENGFDYDAGNWVESEHVFYTYDADNLLTFKRGEILTDGGGFVDYMTLNLYYDEENRLVMDSLRYIPQYGTQLQDSLKRTYFYDTQSNLTELKAYYWAENQGVWRKYYKENQEWDNENRLLSKTFYMANNSGEFIEQEKYDYYWSNTGELNELVYSLWNIGQQVWVNYEKSKYTSDLSVSSEDVFYPDCPPGLSEYYEIFPFKLNEINSYKWQGNQWAQNPFYNQKLYYMKDEQSGTNQKERLSNVRVYPNPASTYIEVSGAEVQKFTLYDITGKTIFSVTNNRMTIRDLQPGIYLYQIQTAGNSVIKDILVVK